MYNNVVEKFKNLRGRATNLKSDVNIHAHGILLTDLMITLSVVGGG